MKIRAHRPLLEDAMKTVEEITPYRRHVYYWLFKQMAMVSVEHAVDWLDRHRPEDIEVRPYHYDSRIGWDTHIVTLKGDAVGFTDGPLSS